MSIRFYRRVAVRKTLCGLFGAVSLISIVSVKVQAQADYHWRAEALNGNWNDANNWWNGVTTATPTGNEILHFDNNVQLTMANNLSSTARFKILFQSGTGARTITGSSANTFFDFGGTQPLIQNSSANNQTISFPIVNGNSTGVNALDIEASGANLTFTSPMYASGGARRLYFLGAKTNTVSGVISNGVSGGSIAIYKEQTGLLALSGNNTFSGGINFNDGELQLNSSTAAGTGAINIGAAADVFSSTTGGTFANAISLAAGANPRVLAASSLVLSGTISGSGGLLRGAGTGFNGTLVLNGTNTFSGGVTLTNGGLQINNRSAIGTGTFTVGDLALPASVVPQLAAAPNVLTNANAITNSVVFNRDVFLISGGQDIELAGPVALNSYVRLSSVPNLIISGTISGAYGMNLNGNLTLNGNNTYSGNTYIESSTIVTVTNPAALGASPLMTNQGTLRISGTAPFTMDKLQYHGGTYDIVNTNGVFFTNHLIGVANVPAAFTKLGIGTLTLSGNSTNFTQFSVNAGTLNFNCPNFHSSSRIFVGVGVSFTSASNSVVNWGQSNSLNYLNIANHNGPNYASTFNVSNGTLQIAGLLEVGAGGNGSLNLIGGNLNVTNGAPVYFGGTSVSGTTNSLGTLNIQSPCIATINGATTETILFGENNTLAAGVINLNGGALETSRTFRRNTGLGMINFNGGTLRALASKTNWIQLTAANVKAGGAIFDTGTFAVTNTQALLHDTNITTDGGLTKQGAGLLTLTATNTYNGDTTISVGTLALINNGSIAASPNISVAGGAKLDVAGVTGGFALGAGQTLKGNGSVAGVVTVNGTLTAGSSIGTLAFSNAPVLNGTILAEVNRTNAQTADKLVLGAVTTLGGTLAITNTGPMLSSGDTFDLFDGPVGGAFTSFALPYGGLAHWRTNKLVVDGTITFTNAMPVVQDITAGVVLGGTLTLQVIGGKNGAVDADGDALVITAIGAPTSGSASVSGSNVTYTASGSLGTNTFTYTVSDGVGGTITKTVTVLVTDPQGFNKLNGPTLVNQDEYELNYLGIPGLQYSLEESPNLIPPFLWYPVVTNTADVQGGVSFTVPLSYPSGSFRTRFVP